MGQQGGECSEDCLVIKSHIGSWEARQSKYSVADRDSCDLFEFSNVEGLHLDVTDIDAEESARRIYQYVCRFLSEGI